MKMNELCNENELIFEYKRQVMLVKRIELRRTN